MQPFVKKTAWQAESVALPGPNEKWHGPVHDIRGPAHQVTGAHGMWMMAVVCVQSVLLVPAAAAPVQHTRHIIRQLQNGSSDQHDVRKIQ